MAFKIDPRAFRRFVILLYKGFLLRKRHYIVTGFEIIVPIIIASIPAIIMSEIGIHSSSPSGESDWINETIHSPFDPLKTGPRRSLLVAYAPSNDKTRALIEESIQIWRENHKFHIQNASFGDADELENYCMIAQKEKAGSFEIIGTIFNNMYSEGESLPEDLDFSIRYSGERFNTDLKYQFYNLGNRYNSSFFLSWQAAVEKAFIRKKMEEKNITFDYQLSMQEFPFPRHKNKNRDLNISAIISMVVLYGFIVFAINIIRRVIEEKSNGSKELLKMMGMTDFIYWSSTFLNYFVVGFLACLVITIVYKCPLKESTVLLEHSNFLLILIFFTLYIASLILFCLALTTFFNKAIFGIIIMIIVYNCSYSLLWAFFFLNKVEINYYAISVFAKFCICLLPSGALLTMCEMISSFESAGQGVRWSNLYSYDAVPDFNVSGVLISMLFSCFLYALIIWYVDAVWPWQYGVPKPFYFPFTKSYWCGYERKEVDENLLNSESDAKNSEFFEDDPTGSSPGVVINQLSKVFRNGLQTKAAVNNVSLNIYNGQITALLGHNGAGKTTTINILTGLYSPSAGTASINGFDIFSQTTKARQSLGVCPQHNVLYDTLTVGEHLKIYAALKGVSWSKLDEETNTVLSTLHLLDKKTELAKNLSGGMKRKLSLGIAIIGGSKVLFLDEPTSGMDVEARRSVWDTLLEIRHNRTIVLTTHYMEEADILGDRIAIMADGEIQCSGSPLFLKNKFGTGYHLHIVKNLNFDLNAVLNVLKKFIPNVTLENDYEGEASFNLMSNRSSHFGPLFEELESKKEDLGVNSCGITVTTMEDVFLNVANMSDLKMKKKEDISLENADEIEMKDIYLASNEFSGSHKFGNKFLGLVLKRVHYAKRHWHVLIPQLILPFVIMCICMSIIQSTSYQDSNNEPSLKLDIDEIYGATDGFHHIDNNLSSVAELVANNIEDTFKNNKINTKSVVNPQKFVLDYGTKSLANYYKLLVVGGTVQMANTLNITAWFNGFPYHAEPVSLLLMDTAILRSLTSSGSITLTNDPLPRTSRYLFEDPHYTTQRILAAVFGTLALSFLSGSFVLVPIHERISKAKLLQMMTGVSAATYWLAMFVWDFLISIIVSIFLIIPFAIFGHHVFFSPHSEAIGTVILFMILYGWSSIPFSYLFSLIFKKPNTGFSVVNVICVITGVGLGTIFSTFLKFGFDEEKSVKAFSWILKIFPSFALSSGLSNLFAISYANAFCDSLSPKFLEYNCDKNPYQSSNPILKCCDSNYSLPQIYPLTMDKDGCGRDLLFLFLDGLIYFFILLLLESSYIKLLIRYCSQRFHTLRKIADNQFVANSFAEDFDVMQEEERIKNSYLQLSNDDAIVVLDLTKIFNNIKAVDHLTFGIHKKECFGLLGVNGAGKTTTFRILCGDCYPTEGNALIGKYSVLTNLQKFQSFIGYCPQFDALIDRLSAREMITLFARLRGLSGAAMNRYVNALIKMTDLTQYADKPSMVYSGGNKRKLSIALALIGAPPLLLLDEPTAGVDPVSRRKIWKILSLARIHSGAAVILTTHSMEESEALCSRLAIMVNGRFRCLGSIQQLKSKFGQGYTLIIKLKKEEHDIPQSMNAVKEFIDTNLPGASLKDDHQGMLQYHVVDPSVTLSYMFKFMDNMKKGYNLEDYVVSDTSLEQIFLAFARSQRVVATK